MQGPGRAIELHAGPAKPGRAIYRAVCMHALRELFNYAKSVRIRGERMRKQLNHYVGAFYIY